MSKNNNFNWQVRIAALSIFFLGFLGGLLALNAYQTWFGAASQPTKQQRYERLFDQLLLSDAQQAEIQKVVGETRSEIQNLKKETEPRFQEIRGRSDQRFQRIMTTEQWEKFQHLRDELREGDKSRK